MKRFIQMASAAGLALLLGACATFSGAHSPRAKSVDLVLGPAIQDVTGPYDAAKACVSKISGTSAINIAVTSVRDVTGRMSVIGNGNGSFLPISATKMMESSLADTGVKLVDASRTYRELVNWYGSKGVLHGAKLYIPQYIVEGTISSLDFLPGAAKGFNLAGFSLGTRTYEAVGRADFSLSTFPFGKNPGGYVIAMTKVAKEFTAVENGVGVGEFVGGGTGARFASFSMRKGNREPMQYAVGYMTDFASVNLVTSLLETLVKEGKMPVNDLPKIHHCQLLLKDAE